MYKRCLCFPLILFLSLLLLAGCTAEDSAIPSVEETTAAPVAEDIILAADGQSLFTLLRPEIATDEEIALTVSLRKTAESLFGHTPDIETDWRVPKGLYEPAEFEILIGQTEVEESKAVYESLPYNSYTLRVVGDKLVAACWRDEAYPLLEDMVCEFLQKHTENGVCTIPADYSDTRAFSEDLNDIPHYDGYVRRVVDLDDGSYMLYVEKAQLADMEAYCAILRDAGYILYTEHTAADNHFATYMGDGRSIHVYYTACYRTLRIVIDPKGTYRAPRAEDVPLYEKITEPKVILLGQDYSGTGDTSIALCMAFLLPNGEFILVDGGYSIPHKPDYLYERLRELAPSPDNIVIAAWYLTHVHTDHVSGFNYFVRQHYKDVTIRQVIFNFTHQEIYEAIGDGANTRPTRTVLELLKDTRIIKAHTGQVFHYPGASVEMLFTPDDYFPKKLTYVNASSLIFRVNLGGQTVMVLGDASEHITPMACNMYGNYLKSDMVQMSHHGLNGATSELYRQIEPHTALWPTGESNYKKNLSRECNQTLLQIAQDLYVARFDAIVLPLPYTPQGNNPHRTAS